MTSKNGQTLNTAWNRRLFVDLNREEMLFFFRENDDRCFSSRQRVNGQCQRLAHPILDARVWRARERRRVEFINRRRAWNYRNGPMVPSVNGDEEQGLYSSRSIEFYRDKESVLEGLDERMNASSDRRGDIFSLFVKR